MLEQLVIRKSQCSLVSLRAEGGRAWRDGRRGTHGQVLASEGRVPGLGSDPVAVLDRVRRPTGAEAGELERAVVLLLLLWVLGGASWGGHRAREGPGLKMGVRGHDGRRRRVRPGENELPADGHQQPRRPSGPLKQGFPEVQPTLASGGQGTSRASSDARLADLARGGRCRRRQLDLLQAASPRCVSTSTSSLTQAL